MDDLTVIYGHLRIEHCPDGDDFLYPFDQYHQVKYDPAERTDSRSGQLESELIYQEYDEYFRYHVLQRHQKQEPDR